MKSKVKSFKVLKDLAESDERKGSYVIIGPPNDKSFFSEDKCDILSSVKTAKPKELIKSAIPWFISGSTWYGLPASTIPLRLFSLI